MKRTKIIISLYTDQDWCFRSKDGLIDYANYFDGDSRYNFACELFPLRDGKLCINGIYSTREFEENFKPTDVCPTDNMTGEEFLKQLKEDLYYGCSHKWIREEFDDMVDSAIDFLKKGEPGIYYGSLKDGNWQPSGLFIVIEE